MHGEFANALPDSTRSLLLRLVSILLLASCLFALIPQCIMGQTAETNGSGRANADIENGIQLFRNHDAAGAKLKFSAAVKENPRSADALTWRGIAENQLKEYSEAVRDFEAALHINADEMSAHYNLALSLIRLQRADEAIEQLRIVTSAHPGVVEPEYNLAILLESKNAIADAVEHLNAAYQTQPGDTGVEQHLLIDLLALGRADDAQPILERFRSSSPAELQEQVGTALIEARQFPQAILLLEGAQSENQAGSKLNLLLARAYIGAQQYTKAIALTQRSETTDRTGESAYLLGLAYSGAGTMPEAKSAFAQAVLANPRNGAAQYHLGMIQSADPQQQEEAIHRLREAVRLEPANVVYTVALSRALLEQDHPEDAKILLQRVHPANTEAAERDLLLGIAQISTSGVNDATPILERAVVEDPSLPLSHNILGFCYFYRGDYARAAQAYQKASDMRPDVKIFAHDAAIAFERSNNSDQALIDAMRAATLPSAGGEDHALVGKLLAKAGRKDDAIRELKQAAAMSPDMDEPYYLLAHTYMQMGDMAQATQWNAKLTELKQKHDRAYAARKNSTSVTSSTLLKGAPMNSSETDAP
jgi:tetratricopeptide (TPR) repeat protein